MDKPVYYVPKPSESMGTHLHCLEKADGFYAWMFAQLEPWIKWGRIWEIGAGTGHISVHLGRADYLCLTEFDDQFRAHLTRRIEPSARVKIEAIDLNHLDTEYFRSRRFDTVISANVIEHIENDVAAFRAISSTMHPGAHLITLVPAHPFLFGAVDQQLGHYRRYTMETLGATLASSGQEVLGMKYFNRLSALGWFVKFRLLRSRSINEFDVAMVERLLPLMKLERFLPLPFGQSLISLSRVREK